MKKAMLGICICCILLAFGGVFSYAADTVLEVEEFTSGVFVNEENDRRVVKVDRKQLPESMKNFTKMSVTGSDNVWTKEQIKGAIAYHGNGLMEYDEERGYGCGKYKHTLVSIYDKDVKPLGYYILRGDEPSSTIILGADKFTSGVSIEEQLKKRIVKVNRDQLPESMKNFAKMSVSGSNREWTMNSIRGVIENVLEHGYGLADYDDQNGYQSGIYEYTMISIYDKDNKLLGYYVVKGNEITSTIELIEFTRGVFVNEENDRVIVKVDREQLPESIKNFTMIRVTGSETDWTEDLIKGVIQNTIDFGYGVAKYDEERGYNSSKYKYTMVSIYDDNVKPLGYYLLRGDEPSSNLILGADKFTSGVSIEEELKRRIVKVNREQLPESMRNFVKMSVQGSNREFTTDDIRGIIQNVIERGDGLVEYDEQNGYKSFIFEKTLIIIFDKDNKPLGYYVVKGNEIIVTVELKEFTDGVTLEEVNDRGIVKVDRTKLPESMKNFTKMSVSGSDTVWTNDLIRGVLQNVLDYGYGLTTYDDVNGYGCGKYKYTMVSIYDNNNKLLGYYIVNGKETNTPLEVKEFTGGVFVNEENDRRVVKVDRKQLPESMKNFTKMSVTGSDNVWTEEQIKGVIQNTIDHGYGLIEYDDERGYGCGKYKYTMVSIYDNNVKPLGYYILKGDEPSSTIILGAGKFANGVSIEEEFNKRIVKVNREQLPESMRNFVKMSVQGSNREFTTDDIRGIIQNVLEHGDGLVEYDAQNGYKSFIFEHTLIIIFDKDNKPLGYYIVKGDEITATVELKEFTSGVFINQENDRIIIKIDRKQLPESMKNFTKTCVTGSSSEWTDDLIRGVMQNIVDGGNGLMNYDEERGHNSRKYEYTMISIHDDNAKPLGYYILKGDEPSSTIILGAEEFTNGVSIEEELKRRVVKVNRDMLPESMKSFAKMSVSGSNNEWTMNNIRGVIENILEHGYGLTDYDDQNGYRSGIYEYTMISIYDKGNKLLGYYVVKGNEIIVTAEFEEFTKGVTIEEVNDYVVVKVDREQLPESMKNFAKMSVAGSSTEWTTDLIKGVIQGTLDHGYGLKVYNDEKGYNSSKYEYTLISIHDNNNKLLGYYIVK